VSLASNDANAGSGAGGNNADDNDLADAGLGGGNDIDGDGIPDRIVGGMNGGVQIQQLRNGQAVVIQPGMRAQRVFIGQGRVRILGGGGNFVMGPNGVAQVGGGAPANNGADPNNPAGGAGGAAAGAVGGETIVAVQPLSDRVVFATSGGRVAAADLAEGKLLWQSRPAKAPVEKLLASDDFVVAKLTGAGRSLLAAMDAFSGNVVFRKAFARDPQSPLNLVNLALSSDGTLVWILPDRAAAKDLFESGDALRFGANSPRPQEQSFAYALSSGEDQLVIADGRILVVAESGMFVEAISMDSGQLLKNDEDGSPLHFATGIPPNSDARPTIRVVGNMLYVTTPLRLVAYDLDRLGQSWESQSSNPTQQVVQPILAVMPGREHLVVVHEPEASGQPGKPKTPKFEIDAYRRSRLPTGGESGKLDFRQPIQEPAGVVTWQAVDGGIYYLAGDQKLHFLAGAGVAGGK